MLKIKSVVCLVLVLWGTCTFAQDSTTKWAATIGGSFVNLSDVDGFDGEGISFQIPNLSLLRYINNGFTVGTGVTFTGVSKINGSFTNQYDLIMMDFFGKYDFNLSENKWVPQIIAGVGLLVKDKYDRASSLNVGAGITYWVLPKMGLNAQVVRRIVSGENAINFGSHTQVSGSLVFTFGESKGRRNTKRQGSGFTTN